MESKTIISKQGTLDFRNVVQGLVMAVLVPVVTIIQQSLAAETWTFNWKAIGMAAVAGAVGYLIKKFVEPTKVVEVKSKTEANQIIAKAKADETK